MDKKSGKPLEVAGTNGETHEATARAEFTPAESSGTVEVAFEIDTEKTALNGRDIVAFERVADESGRIVAAHEDIDDAGQTVTFPAPPESPIEGIRSMLAKTGDLLPGLLLLLIPAGAAGLALSAFAVRKLERESSITIERGAPRR